MTDEAIQSINNYAPTGTELSQAQQQSRHQLSSAQKRMLCYSAAGMCFLSELTHLWILPQQYETFVGYGVIFLLIAVAQGFIGVNLLFEPSRRLLTFGLWVNALIVALYVFTHTIGILVGLAFLPLPIDAFGIVATLSEVVAIVLLFLIRRTLPKENKRHNRNRNRVNKAQASSANHSEAAT